MGLSFKLEVFEGPLDLLLHLIEKNKVDIYDIPIVMITDQYMAYVSAMEKEDMELVSDFLLMAATLLDIKSRMLLPQEKTEEGETEDPRDELVQRLLEYKMCKYLSGELKDMAEEAGQFFSKKPTVPKEVASYEPPVDPDAILGKLTLGELNRIFQSVIKRQEDRVDTVRAGFGTIKKEPFRVSEKIRYILTYTAENQLFSFRDLLERQSGRVEVIVTFLAVLELIKMGRLKCRQSEVGGEIDLERSDDGSISAEELEKALESDY
ncbi:MAG: segregation/condensation protein A [Lachnospiraceae bacterium]|nr:segregation/condensation protein A [Lachnospiraceae bacterium]